MTRAMVRFGVPAEALRSYVSTYYIAERVLPEGETANDLLHPEWANLRYVLAGSWTVQAGDRHDDAEVDPRLVATLYGPTSRTVRVRSGGGMVLGAGLLPSGWARLTAIPACEVADDVIAQEEVFGRAPVLSLYRALREAETDGARFALLDAFLLARVAESAAQAEPEAQLAARAHAVLLDVNILTVAAFAEALGVSERQAQRLSLRCFGFGPKLLLRRQRFLRTLSAQRANLDQPWGSLIDASYYDQAQYVRDFHRFMGMTPTAYFGLPQELLEIAARARLDMFGQPFQALHPAAAAVA